MTPNIVKHPYQHVPRLRAIDEILDATSFAFGATVADMIGGDRTKAVAQARLCAYIVARRCTRFSYPEIGAAIGGRDHTTVMGGVKSAEKLSARDAWFSTTTEVIVKRFGEPEAEAAE